jgi:Sec7-like guanine-nucleotide exchange factor
MTYSELKTNIANFLNRSDLTNQIDFFIDATEAELNRRLRVKDMIKRATATADGQYLSLPTDWLEAINVQIDGNSFQPLFQQSIESMDIYRKSNDNVTGLPIYFALVDNTIELAPTPDSSYTLQLTYYGTVDALSDTNTSNFISTSYPDAYLYGALKHASIYLMEDDRVALFTSQFEKALEEMRMEQEKAEFGKGSLMQRRRTYGKSGKNTYIWKNN